MNIGMLWFDNDPKATLTQRLERAAAYYRTKYGKEPTLCFVNPIMILPLDNAGLCIIEGIEIRASRSVQVNHFWIGVKGDRKSSRSQLDKFEREQEYEAVNV